MSTLAVISLSLALSLIMGLLLIIVGNILAGTFSVTKFFSELPDKIK